MIEFLLLIETLIWTLSFIYIFRKNRLIGVYFAFLFIYGIFAQIGYIYYPELSESINAYFGPDVWYESTLFITASFLMFAVGFAAFHEQLVSRIPFEFRALSLPGAQKVLVQTIALTGILASSGFQLWYLTTHYDSISWFSAMQESTSLTSDFSYALFILLYKTSAVSILALYSQSYRRGIFSAKRILFFLLIMLFGAISLRIGNRLDVLALTVGLLFHRLHQGRRFDGVSIAGALAFVLAALWFMLHIETSRSDMRTDSESIVAALLFKDYFAPAHILFAAVAYEFVNPLEVLISNFSNALIMFNYPFLQEPVTELFAPGAATRYAGYAFYALAEGYIFAGPLLGPVYNGIVLVFMLSIWSRLVLTNSREFSLFAAALMSMMVVGLVRGQSSYLFKCIYVYFVPGMLMYAFLSGAILAVRLVRPSPGFDNGLRT